MNKHMKSHSYKHIEYKCEECEFFSDSKLVMDVHIGKKHSENFECGLCEFEAGDMEALNIHMFTCEIYLCETCDINFITLADLKEHLIKEHNTEKYQRVIHAKQNRSDDEVMDEKYHYAKSLFPKMYQE